MKSKMVWLSAFLGSAGCALAQAAAEGAAAAPKMGATGMSLKQAWEYGGWIMWVLAALSVFGLALVFYLITAQRTSAIAPQTLLTDILAKIRSNELNEVRRLCDRQPCALSAVVLSALDCLRNVPQCDITLLRDTAEAEGSRQAEAIQGQTEFLLDIGTIAPLLGLLGTVIGMLIAFGSVSSDVASAKPVVLASGVSKAIVTTIFGLFVAIPCMAFYAGFRRRANKQIAYLEAASSEVLTALIGMGGKTL
jgi:biopolymer transport protein ExbB